MAMQINVDPTDLTQEQRESLAGFILTYPAKVCGGTCGTQVVVKPTAAQVEELRAVFKADAAPCKELEILQHEHESTLPVTAFGAPVVDAAVAAFGAPAAPLTSGNTCAPLPAGVAPIVAAPIALPPVNLGPASSAAPVTPAGVELDAKGIPWDNRIHADSKNKIADGTWRKKRNLDPATVATVEAELRTLMGAPVVPLAPTPAQQAVTVTTPTDGPASSVVAVPAPPSTLASQVSSTPPAPLGSVPQDARQQFVALVGRASAAIQRGKVTQAEVTQCCAAAGVPALPLLANRLDLVAQVAAQVDALIASRG